MTIDKEKLFVRFLISGQSCLSTMKTRTFTREFCD